MSLQENIRKHRDAAKLNKAQLARLVGVSDVAISYWESGAVTSIASQNLLSLAHVFGISVSELLDDPLWLAAKDAGTHSPAVAAIEYALETEEGLEFLRCWNHGDFDVIRREWPSAPDDVFLGADQFHNAD